MRKLYTVKTIFGDALVDYDKEADKFYFIKANDKKFIFVLTSAAYEQTDDEITSPMFLALLRSFKYED